MQTSPLLHLVNITICPKKIKSIKSDIYDMLEENKKTQLQQSQKKMTFSDFGHMLQSNRN